MAEFRMGQYYLHGCSDGSVFFFHEAAQLDGASRFQKVFLLQNSLNRSLGEMISTFVYQVGLSTEGTGDFSYATTIGMVNNVINPVSVSNSKRCSDWKY